MDRIISALGNRVFLMHNVNEPQPIIFQTRWAMSYLRGPLTRSQVRELVKDQRAALLGPATTPGTAPAAPPASSGPQPAVAPAASAEVAALGSAAPGLPPDVPQFYLPTQRTMYQALGDLEARLGSKLAVADTRLRYDAHLLGLGTVNFVDDKRNVREQQSVKLLVAPPSGSTLVRWDEGSLIEIDERDLAGQPESAALFGEVPATINTAKKLAALRSDLAEYLYRNLTYPLLYSPALKLYSEPGEDERAFKIRLQQAAREQRDSEVDKLQARYQTKLDSLQEKLRREEIELQKDETAYNARKQQEMLSAGDSLLSFFGGRKRVTSALSSASQKRQMTERAKQEVLESQETIAQLNQQIQELQAEMDSISREAAARWDQTQHEIEQYPVRPRKSDVDIQHLAVAWTPQWLVTISDAGGQARTETVSAL
jgi:hypothetical protein